MPCRQYEIYFDNYITGSLNAEQKNHLERHLEICPDCRVALEEEKELLTLLKSSSTPEPGETYWAGLESSILSKTIDKEIIPSDQQGFQEKTLVSSIRRYLIPLAASFILFIGSISVSIGTPTDKSTATSKGEEYQLYASGVVSDGKELNPELFASIMTGPPGSFGRNLALIGSFGDFK